MNKKVFFINLIFFTFNIVDPTAMPVSNNTNPTEDKLCKRLKHTYIKMYDYEMGETAY